MWAKREATIQLSPHKAELPTIRKARQIASIRANRGKKNGCSAAAPFYVPISIARVTCWAHAEKARVIPAPIISAFDA